MNETILGAAPHLLGAISIAMATASLWVWRRSHEVRDDARVRELTQKRRSAIWDDLQDKLGANESKERVFEIIENSGLFRTDCDNCGIHPKSIHDEYIRLYRRGAKRIARAAFGYLIIAIAIVIAASIGHDPFTWSWDFVHGVVGIYSSYSFYKGLVSVNEGDDLRHEFCGLTEEDFGLNGYFDCPKFDEVETGGDGRYFSKLFSITLLYLVGLLVA